MKIRKLAQAALISGVFALGAAPAQASMTLYLDAGSGNNISIGDGQAGVDFNGAPKAITWIGTLGGWLLNVSTGLSNSPGVAGEQASLHLDSINMYTGSGPGTLNIVLTDTGWTLPLGSLTATTNVGGTLSNGGSASFTSKINSLTLASLGTFTSGAFSGSGSADLNAASGYSLSNEATLNQVGYGQMSFNMHTIVPEPALLGLFGLSLLGLGFLRRRRAA